MRTLLLFLFSGIAFAQAPHNWAGGGVGYNVQSSVQGWAAYATLLSDKGPVYNFTEVTITNANAGSGKAFKPQTSVTTGVATTLKTLGKLTIFGFGNAGAAATSSAVGGAFSGGGVAIYHLKAPWTLAIGGQMLKTTNTSQVVASVGIGRSW